MRSTFAAMVFPLTICALLLRAPAASAVLPDPGHSLARSDAGEAWVCPRGDGAVAAWIVPSGIEVRLSDEQGAPLAGVPRTDIWMTSASGALAICGGSMIADTDTDTGGLTSFSHYAPPAGGCIAGQQTGTNLALQVTALGVPIPSEIRIDFNSPDLTGDLRVNLGDVGPFSSALNFVYDPCADFFRDGLVNLADVGLFSAHLGHGCI